MKTATPTKPKERPILFSGPMVRAILSGRKTVTRRVVIPKTEPKIAPREMEPWFVDSERQLDDDARPCWTGYHSDYPSRFGKWFSCNQGKPGDILWVRETFRECGVTGLGMGGQEMDADWYDYRADYIKPESHKAFTWQPSIFMPRAACRLKLRITDVRVERLQGITEQQAEAEGVERLEGNLWKCYDICKEHADGYDKRTSATASFMSLWNSINRKRGHGWDVNPWVWVIEFEKVEVGGMT